MYDIPFDRSFLQLSNGIRHVETFYYELMHIMLKNTELLKHSKIEARQAKLCNTYKNTRLKLLRTNEPNV